jgi:hypothetical protein
MVSEAMKVSRRGTIKTQLSKKWPRTKSWPRLREETPVRAFTQGYNPYPIKIAI